MENIKKLLIANRGEIAVRIIRAAQELNIKTVQVFSDADAESLAVKMADETIHIGEPQSIKSYLRMDKIIDAAKQTGADAIHPGYGFLAENADFADAVVDAGLIFIGPSGDIINQMGDKVSARIIATQAGVPTVPGSDGRIDDLDEAKKIADTVGYPLMIKAVAGGGGKGIRIVDCVENFEKSAQHSSTEALSAFGDGGVYIEKYIQKCRHIEIQILGDGQKYLHFYERDCSLQRSRQKVWEEAPASLLPDAVRQKIQQSAVDLARHVNYKGAGTIEFLYDDVTQNFYFIEMNTRIQVEHPVTEMITQVDLIREMIKIANGTSLSLNQADITPKGHAIEVRINAENAAMHFMPFPGTVSHIQMPAGFGVRFDTALYAGYTVPPFYDSMVGKLIVWDEDRTKAIIRMKRALQELQIGGLIHTKPLFKVLVDCPAVQQGTFDTSWLENWLQNADVTTQIKQAGA